MKEIDSLKKGAVERIKKASNLDQLEEVRIFYLGRKRGRVTEELKSLKNKNIKEKRILGPKLEEVKQVIEAELIKRQTELSRERQADRFDPTVSGEKIHHGSKHPLTIVQERVMDVFSGFNFEVVEGPEVETEYYNFDALNIPAVHPAREMWDTFWLKDKGGDKLLMRTHTSPVQVRYMEKHKPPLSIIVPGRTFRYEATDVSHEVNFNQVEGLMIGERVTLANFKFIVEEFFRAFFGEGLKFRYRPSYFPFTEPSVEVDIKLPGKNKWLEVMGAGMVNKNVLEGVKIDSNKYQGFAFGMGIERLAMIKYNIPDIRMFYSGDLRFIRQF